MVKTLITTIFIFTLACDAQVMQQALTVGGNQCCTYYIDSVGGSDSNAGTLASPFQNAPGMVNCSSNCAAVTLVSGNSVGLKAGDTWRDSITVPASGSAGGAITYTSYGTGAQPVIDGANLLSSGWASAGFNVSTPANLVSALGGNSVVAAFYHGADLSSGLVSTWNDTRGSTGFGPALTASGGARPTANGIKSVTFSNASSTVMTSGLSSLFNLSQSTTLVFVVAATARNFTGPGGLSNNAGTQFLLIENRNNGDYWVDQSDKTIVDSGVAMGATMRLTYAQWNFSGNTDSIAVADTAAVSGNWTQASPASESYILNVGVTPTGNFCSCVINDVLVINGVLSATQVTLLEAWAYNYEGAVMVSGNPVSNPSNTWSIAQSVQPNILLLNRVAGVQGPSALGLNAGQWFWSSNTLYLNSATIPSSAYTSPGVEVPARNQVIETNGKSYLTISGLTLLGANFQGIDFNNPSTEVNITGNTITLNGDAGVEAEDPIVTSYVNVSNNIISWNGGSGVLAMKGTNNWTVQNNTVTNNSQNAGISFNPGSQLFQGGGYPDWQFSGGIRFWEVWTDNTSTIYNILTQNNTVNNNGQLSDGTWQPNLTNFTGQGIWYDVIDDSAGGNIIRNNTVFLNQYAQIHLEHNQHVQAYGNVVYNSSPPGFTIGIYVTDSVHAGIRLSGYNLVANNTVYGNTSYGIRNEGALAGVAGTSINNTFQNNLSINNGLSLGGFPNELLAQQGGQNDGTDGSGNVYTYNGFGVAAANFIQWGTGTYFATYSSWETAAGNCGTTGCSNSLQSDPMFTNPSGGIFTLQAGSPAIGAGLYISGVSTANPPNIGAK